MSSRDGEAMNDHGEIDPFPEASVPETVEELAALPASAASPPLTPPSEAPTVPIIPVDRLRFAVCGCQNYEQGYYTAFRRMAEEQFDFVFHTGDYIYEMRASNGRADRLRPKRPLLRVGVRSQAISERRLSHGGERLQDHRARRHQHRFVGKGGGGRRRPSVGLAP